MAYAAASDVAGLCQNILAGQSNFSTATCPTRVRVREWLTSGCAVIETRLASHGYDTPVASTATAYGWMKDLNSLYAAARVEMSRANVTLGPGERTRGQVFDEMFWRDLDRLTEMDLTLLGVSRTTSGRLYVGGTKVTDKDTWESDTDRVEPRFKRGQFAFPGTIRPTSSGSSDTD